MGQAKLANYNQEDLKLCLGLLKQVSFKGVSINHITLTTPTDIGTTDACETGIGDYLEDGQA